MKGKEIAKRFNIDELRAKKEAALKPTAFDIAMQEVDRLISAEQDKLIRQLGYSLPEDATHKQIVEVTEQMKADGVEVYVSDVEVIDNQIQVKLLVVQEARTITFDLGGEANGSND